MSHSSEEREAVVKQRLEYNERNKLTVDRARVKKVEVSEKLITEVIDARQAAREKEVEEAIAVIRAQKMAREVPDGRHRYEVPRVHHIRLSSRKR